MNMKRKKRFLPEPASRGASIQPRIKLKTPADICRQALLGPGPPGGGPGLNDARKREV
jgi:hypothetical protein